MRKISQWTAIIGVMASLVIFAGCQQGVITTDVFKVPSFTTQTTQQYTEFLYANPNNKNFYDEAYRTAPSHRSIKKQVHGGVLPFDIELKEEIAGYFQRLSLLGNEKEVVVMIAPNYAKAGNYKIVTSTLPYKTPYGLLPPSTTTVEALTKNQLIQVDNQPFKEETPIAFFTPFIKKTFPNAEFIPILIEENLTDTDAAIIGELLTNRLKGKNSIVLSLTHFSNHPHHTLARFQTRYALSLLEANNTADMNNLNIESLPTLKILTHFLEKTQAQTALLHTKGIKKRGYAMEYFLEGPLKPSPEVIILHVGDMMLGRYVATLMDRKGEDYPFEKITDEGLLNSAHLTIGNLEGPIAEKQISRGDMVFNFKDSVVDLLKKHHFNLVTLANNHTLDQSSKGFEHTKKVLNEKGLPFFGNPLNDSKDYTYIHEENGIKIGFIGFHDAVIRMDKDQAVKDITEFKPFVDFLVVSIHWGAEYVPHNTRQTTHAHAFIDAGADAVIGHHPHVTQAIEWYKEKPIIYSLGNFIFDQYWSTPTQKGLVTGLIFTPHKIELYEFPITLFKSQPELVKPKAED